MATQIIAVLCEGPHDVEFLARILKFNGFENNDRLKIKEYPSPISDLLKSEASKTNIDDLNLLTVRQVLLPSSTIRKDDNYFLLYTLGGDSKRDNRKQLLKDFYTLIPQGDEISSLPDDTSLGILYFLDSDDKGIATRISELNEEIDMVLGTKPFSNHKEINIHSGLKLGAFIFTGTNNDTGKLEDVLMPLMVSGNETIFDESKVFLDKHFDKIRVPKKEKYYEDKSIIGVAGQLQLSGSSNTVCIKKSDYLNDTKIKSDAKCIEIANFVNKFI